MASNPFDDPSSGGTSASPFDSNNTDASNPFDSPAPRGGTTDWNHLSAEALARKEEELRIREQRLEYRDKKIRQREADIPEDKTPNWPRCRPMVYHSIKDDIPPENQKYCKQAYFAWLFSFATLVFNAITILILLFALDDSTGGTDVAISLAMVFIGSPLSFSLWYRPIYAGLKREKSRHFVCFFCMYAFHIGLCIYWGIGLLGSAGFINMLDSFSQGNVFAIILTIILTVMWLVNILFGVYLIKRIHGFYRTRGMTMDQARSEAITDVANADATRAAGRAGADWAKSDEGRAAIRAAATSEAGQAAIREGVRSAV